MERILTKGLYIGFAGIDGAGKSTQAGLLTKRLLKGGYSAFFMEINNEFIIQFMNATARLKGHRSGRDFFGHPFYDFAKFFDHASDNAKYVYPLLQMGVHVISPRCKYCPLAKAVALQDSLPTPLTALYDRLPEPNIVIKLSIHPREAAERVALRGHDSESEYYLSRLESAFQLINKKKDWLEIDGTESPTVVHNKIFDLVSHHLHNINSGMS